MSDGSVKLSVIDPHGTYLADALPKLKGFAEYPREFGDRFKRIESVDKIKGKTLYLDLKNNEVLTAILDPECPGCRDPVQPIRKTLLVLTHRF